MNLYWGDMHAQFKPQWLGHDQWEQVLRRAFESAREYLDFLPIVYYPAYFYNTPEGLHVESVGMKPDFEAEWQLIKRLVKEYHAPGRFVACAGYEWTGDRERWGDCNVFFLQDDPPLDLSMHIDDLYAHLRELEAIAVTHHPGYQVGDRGKDWDHLDEEVSPLVEVFSVHGSSEGCNTPRPMEQNAQMGPRVTGGTVQDGLARGLRLGIIASGDNGGGFAGKWGIGLLGVWAEELTREGLWEAFRARRTYGVTGDRIKLRFGINEGFMGDVLQTAGPVKLWAEVEGTQALDRIEVIKNNRVVFTHCHNGAWDLPTSGVVRAKIPVEVGWGPTTRHGFPGGEHVWEGTLKLSAGQILGAEGCFTTNGQKLEQVSPNEYSFHLVTILRGGGSVTDTSQQTVVFEVEAPVEAPITLTVGGRQQTFTLAEALRRSELIVFEEEARELVRSHFGIDPDTVENPDAFYHNACKVKRHTAIPQAGYTVRVVWQEESPGPGLEACPGRSFYYLRVSQLNGQLAWSSPIWVDQPGSR
jgi:hypothetical protein